MSDSGLLVVESFGAAQSKGAYELQPLPQRPHGVITRGNWQTHVSYVQR